MLCNSESIAINFECDKGEKKHIFFKAIDNTLEERHSPLKRMRRKGSLVTVCCVNRCMAMVTAVTLSHCYLVLVLRAEESQDKPRTTEIVAVS